MTGSSRHASHWAAIGALSLLVAARSGPALATDAQAAATSDQPVTTNRVTVVGRGRPAESGPTVSVSGANDYGVTAQDIARLPTGGTTPLTDVLAQMPGVAIDQNQQIHIRNTEGPQFQYRINGVLVPLDINTNPPFLTMINPMFISRLDLLDGILPARYGDATGGVVDIQTKDGCAQPGGGVSLLVGQREILQPSAQYAGCDGKLGYYVSGLYDQGQTAFSSATPGPNPIHDFTSQGQAFGYFSYDLDARNRVSLTLSVAASDNQLPDVANLAPLYTLAGVSSYPSADIHSNLNFRDDLAILAFNGSNGAGLTYQLAYSAHFISQAFRPDNAGELIFQGVASTTTHNDLDNTFQADFTDDLGHHTLGAGLYAGEYAVSVDDRSLVFPALVPISDRAAGVSSALPSPPPPPPEPVIIQKSTTPIAIADNISATNVVLALYLDDLWRITDSLRADLGVRLDGLSGFTRRVQLDPTLNISYQLTSDATLHGGVARYMQVPSFQGIAANAPASFFGTTAGELLGDGEPLAEDDVEFDLGGVFRLGRHFTLSLDDYYERTDHYLDTGQFGVVPIFAPFNYGRGYIWGSEFALSYKGDKLSAYANVTFGQNWQKGVDTGQFNFDAAELAFINAHAILLDHQPLAGVSAGATYQLNPYTLSADFIYSSGLLGGFADQTQLPAVVQLNASIERRFALPGGRQLTDRLALVNVTDRTNLIRAAEGIGIFQAGYGPRFTVLDSVTLTF